MPTFRLPPIAAVLALLAAAGLAGCEQAPELDGTIPASLEDADFPALVPIESLLVPLPGSREESETQLQQLQNRRDRLRERARQLGGPVVDDRTRARMRTGVAH